MKEKVRYILCLFINAFIIAGIIILFIGSYYFMIKAGIPYQDPPLDLRIEYEVNSRIGGVLMKSGFIITACSAVAGAVLSLICLIWKKRQEKG